MAQLAIGALLLSVAVAPGCVMEPETSVESEEIGSPSPGEAESAQFIGTYEATATLSWEFETLPTANGSSTAQASLSISRDTRCRLVKD